MSDEVIKVQHLYKEYHPNTYRVSLRHEAGTALRRVLGRYADKNRQEPFYALRDISFSVCKGEIVGIIGRNGAGKTTLLRLLSGITKPTRGTVEITGRFATLIGLNAGFNYDMSGRKNIYLNSAIFGLQPSETRPIEQAIIDFADIGDSIDMPVKVYSSGMQARLGFSIAMHILPEIVFLDEVLAVGDVAFVKKCFDRILKFKEEHRTVVMVSHSQTWIELLCQRVIWLDHGAMKMNGSAAEVLDAYNHFTG